MTLSGGSTGVPLRAREVGDEPVVGIDYGTGKDARAQVKAILDRAVRRILDEQLAKTSTAPPKPASGDERTKAR